MYTFWFKIGYIAMLLCLLLCSASIKACTTSTTQSNIEMSVYTNGSNSDQFVLSDIVVDSNDNQYILYAISGSDTLIRIVRLNADGTQEWSMFYTTLYRTTNMKTMHISGDGATLRIISQQNSTSE